MKWPTIITVVAIVILLFSSVSIAGYVHLHSPMFKIDFSNIRAFVGNPHLGVELILGTKTPVPVSAGIDQIERLQTTVSRSV